MPYLESAEISCGVAVTLGLVRLLEQSARLGAVSKAVRHGEILVKHTMRSQYKVKEGGARSTSAGLIYNY